MFHRTIQNTSTARLHIPIILTIIRATCRVTAFGSGRVSLLEEFGAVGGAIATGVTATATSTSITISTETILTAQVIDQGTDLGDLAGLADLVALVDLAGLGDLAGLADLAALVDLAGLGDLAGLADLGDPGDLAAVSGSTDQSTGGMLPTQIKERPTDLAVGRNNSPHAELLIGPLPEVEPVGPEEVESPLARRVERRLALVAELAPGHPRAQLPVVVGTA
jgi:hypothetical protein